MAEKTESPVSGVAPDPRYRERYPWHAQLWAKLIQDPARLAHALLLHGSAGLGKRAFALRLAQWALCMEPSAEGEACGACISCRRFAVGVHPDFSFVAPIEDSVNVTVDQIRSLRDFAALTSHTSARKVVIIEPAEAMNINAANALLKLLEEPPAGNLLLLVTPHASRLAPTIRSRCVGVPFRAPPREAAAAWLAQQGIDNAMALLEATAAPLQALEFARSDRLKNRRQVGEDLEALARNAENPLRCATRWKSFGSEASLSLLQSYLTDLIRREMSGKKFRPQVRGLFKYLDLVSEAKMLLGSALDETLLLEDLLIRWVRTSGSVD